MLRLLKQLSEVYSTMRISALAELVPFMPFSEVEAIVVDAVKSDYLQVRARGRGAGAAAAAAEQLAAAGRKVVRKALASWLPLTLAAPHSGCPAAPPQVHIDHRNGTLHFGSQQLEGEAMRSHISLLSQRLSKVLHMLQPQGSAAHVSRREAAIALAKSKLALDHNMLNARKVRARAGGTCTCGQAARPPSVPGARAGGSLAHAALEARTCRPRQPQRPRSTAPPRAAACRPRAHYPPTRAPTRPRTPAPPAPRAATH